MHDHVRRYLDGAAAAAFVVVWTTLGFETALLAALAAVAGVLTPMAQDRWEFSTYDLGMWFAVAVAALGLLGSLKALLTGPKYGTPRAR